MQALVLELVQGPVWGLVQESEEELVQLLEEQLVPVRSLAQLVIAENYSPPAG